MIAARRDTPDRVASSLQPMVTYTRLTPYAKHAARGHSTLLEPSPFFAENGHGTYGCCDNHRDVHKCAVHAIQARQGATLQALCTAKRCRGWAAVRQMARENRLGSERVAHEQRSIAVEIREASVPLFVPPAPSHRRSSIASRWACLPRPLQTLEHSQGRRGRMQTPLLRRISSLPLAPSPPCDRQHGRRVLGTP